MSEKAAEEWKKFNAANYPPLSLLITPAPPVQRFNLNKTELNQHQRN